MTYIHHSPILIKTLALVISLSSLAATSLWLLFPLIQADVVDRSNFVLITLASPPQSSMTPDRFFTFLITLQPFHNVHCTKIEAPMDKYP